MSPIFTLEMLPAREGDALWITYGQDGWRRHLLIDGGRQATGKVIKKRLAELPAAEQRLELVVVSHVDRDHIEGLLDLAESKFDGVEIGDVWFNGYVHLQNNYAEFGAAQGERLGDALSLHNLPWNEAFGNRRAAIEEGQPLELEPLPGGLKLTLLSPTPRKLENMRPVWEREVREAGMKKGVPPEEALPRGFRRMGGIDVDRLAASRFESDHAEANGTSIALLAEFAGHRVLLAADAHDDVMEASLRTLANRGKLKLEAFKIAHHGSSHNLSKGILDLVDCDRFLLSTNGSYFNHPDASAVSRILLHGGGKPELIFNYRSDETSVWDDPALKERYGYTTTYPLAESNGFQKVDLING